VLAGALVVGGVERPVARHVAALAGVARGEGVGILLEDVEDERAIVGTARVAARGDLTAVANAVVRLGSSGGSFEVR
jgi:hypothetical protein